MEILEDPVFKTKYQKYKIRVKLWESQFTEKHGRKPNKNDIKEADIKIKQSYKMYWKLKTRALEETLTDITFSDEIEDNVSDKTGMDISVEEMKVDDTSLRDENKEILENMRKEDKLDTGNTDKKDVENTNEKGTENIDKKDTENIDPQGHQSQSTTPDATVNENKCKNVKGVWGDHLSKTNEEILKKKKSIPISRSSSFQLSQNKFTSSVFTKRNPRKSLSQTKIKSRSEKDISSSTSTSEQTTNSELNNKDGFDVNEEAKAIFGEPVKVTYIESKVATQSINTVQQLIEGHTVNRNLNPGWLNRCAKQSNLEYPAFDSQRLSGTCDSGIESMESITQSPTDNVSVSEPLKLPLISDEEDFVCNSDTEEEHRKKRIRNFRKRFSDQENQSCKRLCTDNSISTPIPSKMDVQTMHSIKNISPVSSEEKSNNLNITNIAAVKINSNVVCNNVNIKTNLADNIDKCNDNMGDMPQTVNTMMNNEEDIEISSKGRPENRRKVRRRIKRVSSDDSDFNESDTQEKESKTKKIKTTRVSSTRKNKATKESRVKTEKKREVKTRRPRKKKDLQDDEDILNTGTTDQETAEDKGSVIYGIETLQAVPRFAMSKYNQGDLIEQCAKSVCSTTDDLCTSDVGLKPKGKLTEKEKLEKKVADGKVNENFVRINLKRKIFVRGKKHFNFSKYKKNQWKQRKKDLGSSEGSLMVADFIEKNSTATCFKCGEAGHFSRRCPNAKGDDLISLNEIDESSEFPTLEEAQEMASQKAITAHANRINRLPEKPSYSSKTDIESAERETEDKTDDNDLWEPIENEEILCGHKIPKDLVQKLLPPQIDTVQRLYELKEDQSCIDTPAEVYAALRQFGHEAFRFGQEKVIMRILSGLSTLVTLSTGSGKSLCYQLPAYLYSKYSKCITLVISPLVSLMDDQVTGVPSCLSACCLHTGQTPKVRDNVMQMVKQGKVDILLISPEAVVAGEKSTFGSLLRQLPSIAFACIDEAHCISQWSHNFRPSYLMVCRVLKEKLGVKTVLALTATATKATAESIINHVGIPDGMEGVISDIPLPRNLLLTVSKDEYRDQALIQLLQSERFQECNSVIVYCTLHFENFITLTDVNNPDKVNSKLSSTAEAYHAGLSAHRRKIVQKAFMNGQTRIVVATVAFGMGLNKPDIRAVIHYNMPDCHLFISPREDNDKWELRRHIYANGVDRHVIRRLLQKIFVPCSCSKIREKNANYRCPGHEVAIPVDETVAALDVPEEIISTLLCYLELHPKRFITVLSSVYARARVSSYAGPQALKQAAQSSPPLAMAIALDLQKGISHENDNIIEFPVVDVASAIGWDSGVVKNHLKNLEWKTVNGTSKRSAISVRYDQLGFRVQAPGDLTDEELDEALDALHKRTQDQEIAALQQLETIGVTLHKFGATTVKQCLTLNDEMTNKSDQLKDDIRSYFTGKILLDMDSKRQGEGRNDAEIASDVRNLIMSYRDNNFTGRAVARIFHGIQSPNYPAYVWHKCRFWRAHLSFDFSVLCQIATREILASR
ncbi:PREDICTED: ATP-dependent DNA helicase Q4 [Habropoda laboriosa]|uniref:ATP-dependent DNA helicase Q4 n=1 Tax=Habropoda laboriosa TaxID=597456 RepID=UPI00083CD986|nr:PREDICTED: ATP-dependent DNA helicase Q4 [Habropoda laboriosa]